MQYYRLGLYVLFGILPSLTWLSYYLKKDMHPEPKRMIVKVFLYGAIVTIPVFFIQIGLAKMLGQLASVTFFTEYPLIIELLKWFVVIALVEELLKYAVVRLAILHNPEFDEPLDLMLYMVVAALGFAAVENVLYLFAPIAYASSSFQAVIGNAATISFIRFVGATFLHTLCSALVGYFMALASLRAHKTRRIVFLGIMLATTLHGLYNFSIITLQAPLNFGVPIAIIVGLTIFMIWDFNEIKKIKSICKI